MSASEQTSASKREPLAALKEIADMKAISALPEHLHALIIAMKIVAKEAIEEIERPSPQQQPVIETPGITDEDKKAINFWANVSWLSPNITRTEALEHIISAAQWGILHERSKGQPDELSKAQERIAKLKIAVSKACISLRVKGENDLADKIYKSTL